MKTLEKHRIKSSFKSILAMAVGLLVLSACNDDDDAPAPQQPAPVANYPAGTVHCIEGGTAVVEVLNPQTGRTWMDRNLGATQAAASAVDEAAYGDLYQWGRFSDGHQCRSSTTTGSVSSIDTPGHGDFITAAGFNPGDWRSPQNDELWQGPDGSNNPCPEGYRLPTGAEWEEEQATWTSEDIDGAFGSPLKLTAAGYRINSTGALNLSGTFGIYWGSTVSGIMATDASFSENAAFVSSSSRAFGYSVRCIKEE